MLECVIFIVVTKFLGSRLEVTCHQQHSFELQTRSMAECSNISGYCHFKNSAQFNNVSWHEGCLIEISHGVDFAKQVLDVLLGSSAPGMMIFVAVFTISLMGIVTTFKMSRKTLLAADAIAFSMTFSPIWLPYKGVRFLYGIYTFVSFMIVHACIVSRFREENENASKSTIDLKTIAMASRLNSFAVILESVVLWPVHMFKAQSPRFPLKRMIYFLMELLMDDACVYLIKEFIPEHISLSNQLCATAIISGVWVLLTLDVFYSGWIIVFDMIGHPMAMQVRHRHPLLSSSLSEFWGVRWNPVVCHLLQESFYKPLRRLGANRVGCILGCFIGSCVLHALPQYLSTHNLVDLTMMGGFFLCHGVLVLLERLVLEATGAAHFFDTSIMAKKGGPQLRAHFQWLVESLTVASILTILYTFEMRSSVHKQQRSSTSAQTPLSVLCVGLALGTVTCVLFWNTIGLAQTPTGSVSVKTDPPTQSPCDPTLNSTADSVGTGAQALRSDPVSARVTAALRMVGWAWTLVAVVCTMPLFSVPVLHTFDSFFSRSVVVGRLVEALGGPDGVQLSLLCRPPMRFA